MKGALALLMASLLAGAAAQSVPSVPAASLNVLTPPDPALHTPKLTSVGQNLLWMVGDQTLTLEVRSTGPVTLTLASPALDPNDYRSPDEYGDERYDNGPSETVYTLSAPDGRQLAEYRVSPDQASQRLLFSGALAAGRYTLSVRTTGRAKNSFAVSATGFVRLTAGTVNLNLRSHDWLDVLEVVPGQALVQLRLYDADGPNELEMRLIAPDGSMRPLVGSGQLQWSTFDLPAGAQGYRLQARQPQSAKQYSNTIGVGLVQNGQALPITLQDTPLPPEPAVAVTPAPVQTAPVLPVQPTPVQPAPEPIPAPVTESPAMPPPVAETPAPEVQPAIPLPTLTRESRLDLPFDAPAQATRLVLAETLPAGASYLPGSSRLNGQTIADPLVGASGRLYWPVNPMQRGVLSYRVTHTDALPALPVPSLLALYTRDRQEVLQGPFDLNDYTNAKLLVVGQAAQNPGAVKLPLDGTVIRDRDRVTVVVDLPAGSPAAPTIGGVPLSERAIGQRDLNAQTGTERVTYFGIPLKPGENVIALGGQSVRVYYAGQAARIEVTPVQDLADGSTPLRFRVRALDANGLATGQPTLTLRSSIEPQSPDADPGQGGYQLALKDGEGELILPPQTTPGPLNLEFAVGNAVQRDTLTISPDVNALGIGAASATLGLSGGQADFTWTAKGYYEGTLLGGKLYATGNKDGLPVQSDPNRGYALFGDQSTETVPLQGIDPIALRYEAPGFSVQYRLTSLPIDVLPLGEQITALTANTKGGNLSVGGFAALVPTDRVTDLPLVPDGTRLLRLPNAGIVADSETLVLVTRERGTGKEISRRTLTRLADYVIDLDTGVVTLARALTPVDENLSDVVVLASYRLLDANSDRRLAAGAQVKYTAGNATFGVAAATLDGKLTSGVSARYATPELTGSALAMTQGGGLQISGDVTARLGASTDFGARVRYQDAAYNGLAPFNVGLSLNATARTVFTPRLTGQLGADYTISPTSEQGNVAARVDYTLSPFSVGGGLRYSFGDQQGVSGLFGVGYHAAPFDLDVTHSQPFGGNVDPETVFSAKVALTPNVRLILADDVNWRTGQVASVGLETTLGRTNLSAGYALPNASGTGNRARFGVDTSLPLDERFTLGLRGSLTRDMTAATNDFSVGGDLRYLADRLSASAGTDVAFTAGQWKTVLRAGATGALSDTFSLTADALTELSATPGARLTLGYAWRDGRWNSLGTLRYQGGSLAGDQPRFTASLAAEYHEATWALRGGLDARVLLNDPGSFTYQPSLGGTYYLNDYLGVGAWGRALIQPATGTTLAGLGLEGSVRALPGTWLTLGYNVLGFDGLGNTFTKPGPYLRLDVLLDETIFGKTTGEKK